MLKNYFKVAWRNLTRNSVFSFINIAGLALGMACSLLIFLWVRDEYSIDHIHANGDRLQILYEREHIDGKIVAGYWTPGLLAAEIKRKIPEVEYASATTLYDNQFSFEADGKIIKENGIFADSDYFKMFSYPLLQGNVVTALTSPTSIAISEQMARRFFGSPEAAIAKTIRYQNSRNFTVTAVFAEPPANITQKFDFVVNWMAHLEDNGFLTNWENNSPQTVIMLRPDVDRAAVAAKLKNFLNEYNHSFTKSFWLELYMQPYEDLYLHSNFVDGQLSGGRIEYVRLFSVVAIFILVIACINFMNLTTARSAKRSREIGIRKVAGAIRGALVRQFLGEAVFIAALSLVLAILLVILLLPFFNALTGKQIAFPFANYSFWLGLGGLTFLTGLLAGSYPAFFLSGFKPIQVLKSGLKFKGNSVLFRKGLVVFQFSLSILLIIGTIVITRQINYVQHANLGFDRDNLVYIPLEGELSKQYSVFKQQTLAIPGVKAVSVLSDDPTNIGGNITSTVSWSGKDPNVNPAFAVTAAGYDFVKTMKLTLVEGRDFSRDFPSDSSAYLINEEALALLKYKDPIGMPLKLWDVKGTIVGVLKNFHLTSLHDPIAPLIVQLNDSRNGGCILVRTGAGSTKNVLTGLKRITEKLNPKFAFTSYFAEDEFRKLYRTDEVVGRLSNCFAILAIFISCMGLLGLVIFTAEQKAKEFSIRKVLGASAGGIFSLLSKEFILLVSIAILLASPIAWWLMNHWLQNYSYHISIEWWIFVLAAVVAVLIALATVSVQALKTALVNPIRGLRSE